MTFPQAIEVQQLVKTYTNAQTKFISTTTQAILDAADGGASTTSALDWSSATLSEAQILSIIGLLKQQGYGVTLGSGTITVTW